MNLYEKAVDLFGRYPLAVEPFKDSRVRPMVLMTARGGKPQYFVLVHESIGGGRCELWPWHGDGDALKIEPGAGDAPRWAVEAVTGAVPLPRNGSLFGWAPQRSITALIIIYTQHTAEHPEPGWTPMILAGTPERDWPEFTAEHLFGQWFWDHCRAGRIVEAGTHIAASSRAVWWVDTEAALGSNSCAVARPLTLPGGVTLPRGLFVYDKPLRDGTPVPSLEEALASRGKTDLGPRFREAA